MSRSTGPMSRSSCRPMSCAMSAGVLAAAIASRPAFWGRHPEPVDGRGVEIGLVVVVEFLCVAARRGILRQAFQDLADLLEGALLQLIERAPASAVSRNFVTRKPMTIGILIEVIAGLRRRIARGQIDAPRGDLSVRAAPHGGCEHRRLRQ